MKIIAVCIAALGLLACTQSKPEIRVEKDVPKPAAPVAKSRTEPIFYNGKTYTLKLSPDGQGNFDLAVLGMSDKQQKDAVAVGTSSVRYFACPDGKTGKLTEQPSYASGTWRMQARCG
jgi:hypothetical protein